MQHTSNCISSFYFPGFLVGPYLEFASYASLIDESLFSSKGKKEAKSSGRRIPSGRKRVAYRKMLIGLAFLGMYVTQIGTFNFAVSLQDWFLQKGLLYRYAFDTFEWIKHVLITKSLVFIQICGFFERTKYYAIWTLTEVRHS